MDVTCSGSGDGSMVQVCFPGARAVVLDNLNRQREEGRLCDLSIHVQGQVFRAHRCVLAASSPYFHDQVLLKNVTTVSLPSVMDPVAFESVLSSAYTGQLSIVHDDIVNYVTVASFLQMWHIVDKCTEILKRPRPPSDISPGSASRQQSPSSTDCLYSEREGRRKERKPDALPPLATWRRPQQFPRWGRPRPSSGQHLADSQLDCLPAYTDSSDYSSCEEAWASGQAKTSHFVHEGPGHNSRQHGALLSEETLKQKLRIQQRGTDRLVDKNREIGDSDGTQEKRKNERKETGDNVLGDSSVERKEDIEQIGQCDFNPLSNVNEEATVKLNVGEVEDKLQRATSSDVPSPGPQSEAFPGLSCPASVRVQWQMLSWSHQEPRSQDSEVGSKDQDNEEDAHLGGFTEGTFSRDTFDEIEKGTGQVSQRPLIPVSPDLTVGGSEGNWHTTSMSQGASLTPTSTRHLSTSSATFPPPSSPPTPSSSSSVPLTGASFAGKVHFCHCGKAYALKSMRDRHVKMQHLNLRPFGCPVCTKSFKMKHHLTKHLKTHGGLRPYECSLCGKKVIWKDSFLRHQARCERLASSSLSNSNNTSTTAAADIEGNFSYGFDEGQAFLAPGGQVKVEQVDFQRPAEDGMGRLLGSVDGIVDELQSQSESVGIGSHVFKEEANESSS